MASDFFFALSFSMTCSGAWTTTYPAVSKPARPARPAIWRNSRVRRIRCRFPSNFASPVNSTVRIGTLMPTPRVSVPQMTRSSPAWASCSTSRRYFGSIPAWWTPIPLRISFDSVLPKPAPNRNAADPGRDRLLVGALADPRRRQQRRRVLDRGRLGEVHDVHRRLVGRDQLLERLGERRHRPGEVQRHRAYGVGDDRGRPAVAPGQVVDEAGDVAERGRHQQELRLRQLQQRHLPRPAAVRLGVEVELVHHHEPDVRRPALAQRDVGQHLGGAADDRGVRR